MSRDIDQADLFLFAVFIRRVKIESGVGGNNRGVGLGINAMN